MKLMKLHIVMIFWLVLCEAAFAQTVKFVGKRLQINNQPFLVKGVNESLFPINTFPSQYGICYYDTLQKRPLCPWFNGQTQKPYFSIYDIDPFVNTELGLTAGLKANTYRTFGEVILQPSPLLQRANQYGVKVIAGYWVDYGTDFTFPLPNGPSQRQKLINDFVNYINRLKTDPNYSAVLLIGLSNEMNLHWCEWVTTAQVCAPCDPNQQAAGFYDLANEMARSAKAGDPDPRPMIIVSADLGDIGDAARHGDDAHLPDIDGWGVNAYKGSSFYTLFTNYAGLSQKPMLITEFGGDAWDRNPRPNFLTGGPDEVTQESWVESLWNEIKAEYQNANGVAAGGIYFQLADNWWQGPGDVWNIGVTQHNPGGWDNSGFPDGKADVEFLGLFDRQPGPILFLDTYVPRKAALKIYSKFSLP